MCTIFKSHKLWDMVENGYEQPVKKEEGEALTAAQKLALEENVAKDAKALGLIQELAKEAWEILQQEFRGDKKVRSMKLQALRREFEYTRMHDDESLSGYVTKLLELVNQMKAYGEELTKQRIVQKLLISLSSEYDSIAEVIEETNTTTKKDKDDGNSPSCIRFSNRRGIDRHLFGCQTTTLNHRRC
ncbi:unnamed protein product [Prunus armeniaca]